METKERKIIYIEGLDKAGKDTLADKLKSYLSPHIVAVRSKIIADCNPYTFQYENSLKEKKEQEEILRVLAQAALFDFGTCLDTCRMDCFANINLIIVSLLAARSYSYHAGFRTGLEMPFKQIWDRLKADKIDLPVLLTVSPEARAQRTDWNTASQHDLNLAKMPESAARADAALRDLLEDTFKSRLLIINSTNLDPDQVLNIVVKKL